MITRTSQPASGAMLISEMKEFASFPKSTQRYIRRSLDVAYGRRDADRMLGPRRRRSRFDPRPGPALQATRPSAPAGARRQRPRHDRAVHRHADHACRAFDLGQDRLPNFAAYRFLYERLIGASARPWLPAAFCAAAALAAPPSRPPPDPAPVDQRKRGDRAGLVEPRAGVLAGMGRKGRPRQAAA